MTTGTLGSTATAVYGLGGGNPAEIASGGSSDYPNKAGFFGTTPVAQQSTTLGAAVATTVAVSTTSNIWGFSTSTQANNVISLLNSMYAAMTTYGLLSS